MNISNVSHKIADLENVIRYQEWTNHQPNITLLTYSNMYIPAYKTLGATTNKNA